MARTVDKKSATSHSSYVTRMLFQLRLGPLCFWLAGWIIFSFSAPTARANEAVEGNITKASLAEFAKSPLWLNTMYYVPHGHGYESLVINDDYFVAKQAGRHDPLLELKATLELFRQTWPAGNTHPQCQFPFRYRILRKLFNVNDPLPCPAFDEWLQSYAPTGLSLAYASQYVSNPSSAFGHSFLVATSEKQVEGLWLTYNYAGAIPERANPFAYVVGGLTGWFKGDFSIMPFHQRLFQYGNIENRDLWLYPIRLNTEELDLSLRRLWELVHRAQFLYYFLDENCAGALLRAFAPIIPDVRNRSAHALYIHPVEIIKRLDQLGRIGAPRLIPSQFAVLKKRVAKLNDDELKGFKGALSHPDRPVQFESAAEADAVIEYTAYLTRENEGELPDEYRPLERTAYLQRGKFGVAPDLVTEPVPRERSPHLAHDSMAADFGGSVVNDHWAANLGYRISLHGQTDPGAGFIDFSSFEFFKILVSANDRAIWLQDLTLANVENFQPLWLLVPKPSWRADFHLKENLLGASPVDQYFEARLSYGVGIQIGRHLLYSLLVSSMNFGQDLPQSHLELGPEFGFIFKTVSINATAYVNLGSGAIDGTTNRFLKAGTSLNWALKKNFSLIQENDFSRLVDKDIMGYLSSLNGRWYF